jgi:hypothetical protein
MDQIAIATDRTCHLLTPRGIAIEGLLNGLHGKVGVTAVNDLENAEYPKVSQGG